MENPNSFGQPNPSEQPIACDQSTDQPSTSDQFSTRDQSSTSDKARKDQEKVRGRPWNGEILMRRARKGSDDGKDNLLSPFFMQFK